jgi:2-dehydro-3-deoxyphosphogalactonate aldolase
MVMRDWLQRSPLIAILRGIKNHEVEPICRIFDECGIHIVEIPLNSPEPVESIRIAAELFGDHMLIGAGTVTRIEDVRRVADVGGRLIVAPDANPEIVHEAKRLGLFSLPGVATATEAFAMLRAGADGLKIFPADVLGQKTVAAFRAVLPKEAILIPVGGIDAESIPRWRLQAINGFGVGSALYKPGRSLEEVQLAAQSLTASLSVSL